MKQNSKFELCYKNWKAEYEEREREREKRKKMYVRMYIYNITKQISIVTLI